ncbi:MAG: flagellar hook-basal body complex protein FliE [Planctomycetales bacterium]|nr:flagellar hook-basal body complex protein FliE [Planctomycetales bacterium]MCA9170698.1 flagellar hook-basal body complex protein FliE [Planctomycetales bacterium]
MAVTPMAPITGMPSSPGLDFGKRIGSAPAGKSDASFSQLVEGLLDRANAPHVESEQAFSQLVNGETDNVHDVVMSVVKADLSFRMVLEMRNRLTEAYQEIMRMQV